MKKLIFIIMVTRCLYGADALNGNDPVDVLINNKARLIKSLSTHSLTGINRFNPGQQRDMDTLFKLLELENLNRKEREKITRLYLSNCGLLSFVNKRKRLVSDSIDFNFLIKTLQTDTGYNVIIAYDKLIKQSDINRLRRYRNSIKAAFVHTDQRYLSRKVALLTLATDSTMLHGLSNDTSSLEGMVRKRLTDTLYENNLIRTLDSNKLFYEKEGAIYQLLLQGNRRSLMALVKHFNEPLFNISNMGGPCTSMTLRMPIIEGMGRFYPDVPLLTDSLYLLKMNDEKKRDRVYVAWYFREFLKWAKQEFGVEPKDPELPPVISQGCRTY